MSIYRRGRFYAFNFWTADGRHIQRSTKASKPRQALHLESECRLAIARGEEWPAKPAEHSPTVGRFLVRRVYRWAVGSFKHTTPKNLEWYRVGIRAINSYAPLRDTPLDQLTSEMASRFAAFRREQGKAIATCNSALRVLRSSLNLGMEWGVVEKRPKIRLLSGEKHRDMVLTREELDLYLLTCEALHHELKPPQQDSIYRKLADVVAILADSAMRCGELFSMKWEAVSFDVGRNGMLYVIGGKTPSARRGLPLTPRMAAILRRRWQEAGEPQVGNIFPAETVSGHVEASSFRRAHRKAIARCKVRYFSFHTLRHSRLTALGATGLDVFSLARLAGHSSPRMTSRYVHVQDDSLIRALEALDQLPALPAANTSQGQTRTQ